MLFYTSTLLVMSICLAGPEQAAPSGGAAIVAYELYSWQDAGANWVFALLPNTNREKTVKEVFDPRFRIAGIDGLKKRVSKLREKTTIFMLSHLPSGTKPKAKGSEPLKLPPADIIKAIMDHAKKHNITVEILDAASP
jgi:hypothetical protein